MQKENLFFFADIYCFESCMQQNECGSKPKIERVFFLFLPNHSLLFRNIATFAR